MTEVERYALIASALVYWDTHSVEDVLAECHAGRWQMWEGRDSLVVTQVKDWPRCKEVFAVLAAGRLDEVARMYPVILAWAKDIGCTKASFSGRPGWGKTFLTKAEGWRQASVTFEKGL